MGKNLVIVESPSKAKTIKKYLGKDYEVTASVGHIEDLPASKLGVDIENNFEPEYEIMKGKKKVITDLKKLVKKSDIVYLATDKDREGEAISWHLQRTLKLPRGENRISFHEITKKAIQDAIKSPRAIDMDLVHAQEGRRILDRLVGYKISPILWKKIKMGLSAGRVQSVSVKLIIEKENEIKNFKEEELWNISGKLKKENLGIILYKLNDKLVKFSKEKQVKDFLKKLGLEEGKEKISNFKISDFKEKEVKSITFTKQLAFELVDTKKTKSKKKPPIPFMTSTLQQEASSKLGRGVKQVMQVAQKLYEQGYITYMRTDDPSLSPQAIKQAEKYIISNFGKEYSKPTQYKSKSKNSQEAHEAIRPTNLSKTAQNLGLSGLEAKLYNLIWGKTLASQMKPAEVEVSTYYFSTGNKDIWTCKGEVIKFEGFLKVYGGGKEVFLPKIKKGENIQSKSIIAEQKFTKASSRYTESALVKKMESLGIGRPSTYASVISTIIARGYVKNKDKKLVPTEIAFLVVEFLQKQFNDLMDYDFTAKMEATLDKVAEGKKQEKKMLNEFWKTFESKLKDAESGEKILQKTGGVCPKCGSKLVYKFGRFGKFIACENYPDCKYTEQTKDEQSIEEDLNKKFGGKECPAGGEIVVKKSRNGYFLASSLYPEVKWTMSPDVFELSKKYGGESCDKCGEGQMVVRKGKRGYFLGCNAYPKCKNIKKLDLKKES